MVCKVYCPTSIEQDIGVVPEEGYNPYFFPVEGAYLPFFFTDETFVKVLSALINGAAVTYGDEGRAVVWEFLRNVEFPVNMCQIIADCINDLESPARAAVRDLVMNDPDIANYILQTGGGLTESQIASPVVDNGCENSDVAGAVIAIVERINDYNVDALEIIEVATNDEEKVAAVLEGIPIMGELPIGDILGFAQDILEDFFENYNGAVTETWKDSVAEDLYCLALEDPDCKLNYAQLFNYFQERAGSSLTLESTILEIIDFVRTGDFNTDELIASGMYAINIAFVRVGREFFGVNLPKIGALTRDASPSTAWEDWDDCESPVDDCIDFTDSNGGFAAYPSGVWAIYYLGQGWGNNIPNFGIAKVFSEGITKATVRTNVTVGSMSVTQYNGAVGATINTPGTEFVFDGINFSGGIRITMPDGYPEYATARVTEICLELVP